jgi:hypothetical protein
VHCSASREPNVDALFFTLGWDWYEFHKKHAGTPYTKLVFSDPVLSAVHVVQFGVSGARNIHALFFMLEWDWCGFHKKRVETYNAKLVFLHLVRSEGHIVHSGASGA